MIKIFGHPASTCTRKVLMTLAETSTPYELTTVDFAKGEHKQQPHLSRQPFGQVPSIDDDGFAFFESRAICRYLNEKARGNLVPSDIKGRALTEEWISIETSNFSAHAMKFIYHDVMKRAQEQTVLDAAGKGLNAAFTVMEATLAKTPFLAGAQFTLGDVFFMPYLDYGMSTPIKAMLANFPKVSAWWGRISERPTWLKTVGRA
ncbi:MAG: glutathione S-transferase [Polyangiales bacterium]